MFNKDHTFLDDLQEINNTLTLMVIAFNKYHRTGKWFHSYYNRGRIL